MSMAKTKEVNAILGEEFDALLDGLGIREQFESGHWSCANCHGPIDRDNVLLIFPLPDRKVGMLCRKSECVVEYRAES